MEERLWTPDEVAERLRVAPGTVREWIRTGRLRGMKLGRVWRIRQSQLAAFLERAEEAGAGE